MSAAHGGVAYSGVQTSPFCVASMVAGIARRKVPNGGYLKPSLSTLHLTRTSAA